MTDEPTAASLSRFTCAGVIGNRGLDIKPAEPPAGRTRHAFGSGPFAQLVMPDLPAESGMYAWELDGVVMYIGQTRTPLSKRLGSNGYARTISRYNTLARQRGRRNGGQQTNCRINALANASLATGHIVKIWYRVCAPEMARVEEAGWMAKFGTPEWNRRLEYLERPIGTARNSVGSN